MSDETRVVFISIPREEASRFARELVEQQLAACVNIIPKIESFYRWEGKVLTDAEALLIVKTSLSKFSALEEYVMENHPYELPELIAMPITEGLNEYLSWVRRETE
jgi:periplasmic divalent cation tolerance protein